MPAIVDHNARRHEIAKAVGRIVASKGLQAVTIRATAEEVGFSTTLITHYFDNKEALMSFSYFAARDRTTARVERAIRRDKDLRSIFSECLPTTKRRRIDWMLWFGLWGVAIDDKALQEERIRGYQEAQILFAQVLRWAQEKGEVGAEIDCDYQAIRIMAFINGLASLAAQAPTKWPRKSLENMLDRELKALS